ncbi:2-aminoadipate transaminase-like [Glandiceps talaboti]
MSSQVDKITYFAHYYEEIGSLDNPDITALDVGAAGVPELKQAAEIFQTAAQARLADEANGDANLMQYGFTMGDPKYLSNLAEFLTTEYGEHVDSDNLMATSGASQGIITLGRFFLQSGDFVFLEDLTHFSAIEVFGDDLDMNLVSVPRDDDGIDIRILDEKLTEYRAKSTHKITEKKPFWAIVYVIPCFHNPTGISYSEEKCQQLVNLARKHEVLILSDDVYSLLSYHDRTARRLFAYDDKEDADYQGNVASVGSFSKIFAPGIRLGWYELPRRLHNVIRESGYVQSACGFNTITSGIMATAMDLGLVKDNLSNLCCKYKKRMNCALRTLEEELPPNVKFTKPKGGYHLWIVLPENYSTRQLLKECREQYKVSFQLGPIFSPDGVMDNCLRLSIAYYHEDVIIEAIKRLSTAIKRFIWCPKDIEITRPEP